jgi:hypothetical protein
LLHRAFIVPVNSWAIIVMNHLEIFSHKSIVWRETAISLHPSEIDLICRIENPT